MTSPSTANSKDPGGTVRPVVEDGAKSPGGTRPDAKGEAAPRLPHERDESSDSGTGPPSEVMEHAADDVQKGRTDEPRGPETQKRYSELTDEASEAPKRD
jgi:hypothetical protein